MKKFTISLLASLALFQAAQAESSTYVSPVNLSLQHYEALTANLAVNPSFQNIIPEGEFIVDMRIQRRSINVTEGNVYVNIITRLPGGVEGTYPREEALTESKDGSQQSSGKRYGHCKRKWANRKRYVATLQLTPSEVGTPNISVVSIEPAAFRSNKRWNKEGKPAENVSNNATK